jgi:dTDP-4-amino-4,6-dideoxygalactose transaminase
LEQAAVELRRSGTHVGAIVPVDLLGKAVDYTAIGDVAEQYEIPLLADAAESLGASHRGAQAGSFGRASVVSFNGNKIMTTSGGGMLLTNDEGLAARTRYLATQARQPAVHYEHTEVGYNYRMSNLLAALGRAQLSRLDSMLHRRREIRDLYRAWFSDVDGVKIFGGDDDANDNCWLTSIVVDPTKSGWLASELSAALAEQNIESRPLWKPMHLQPVFAGAPALINGNAEQLFETGITLPSGSALTPAELDRIEIAIKSFLAVRR